MHSAGSSSGNLSNLSTGRHQSGDRTGLTHVLLVTTTVRVIDRVHGNTTNNGPLVSLGLVLVESTACLEHGLVGSATASNQANHGTALVADGLLGAGGEADSGGSSFSILRDNDGVVTGGSGKLAAVTDFGLDVADNGTLRDLAQGQHVADGQGGLLAAEHRLASVHALRGNNQRLLHLELVGRSELNTGQGGTTSLVMQNLTNNALDITVTLCEVQLLELCNAFSAAGVGLEHRPLSLSLAANNLAHFLYNY